MTGTPTTTVPAWLCGPWVRTARTIDDAPPEECSDVVWLQVGPWFADLRLPRPGRTPTHPFDTAHAFSGRLEVLGPVGGGARVAWHHDLDTDASDPGDDHTGDPDTAVVGVRDAVLIESGDGYVEWWERPRDPSGGADHGPVDDGRVLESGGGPGEPVACRVVCTGGMAVAVWSDPVPGGAWCSSGTGWEPARVVGAVPAGLDLGRVLRALAAGDPVGSGWREVGER